MFGRLGKVLYGVGTGSWMTNGSHLLGFGGEPRHQWNMNAESVVQMARVTLRDGGGQERRQEQEQQRRRQEQEKDEEEALNT